MAYSDEDLIKAALMDDPEDPKEESSTDKKEVAGEDDSTKTTKEVVTTADENKETEAEDESNEDPDKTEEEANEEAKTTRKERREERKKNFLESIKADTDTKNTSRERLLQSDPNYKPVDYDTATELDVSVLNEDRTKYGNNKFSEGANTERHFANQERFWDRTEFEGKLLEQDPQYAFLNENNPDTFNADKAEELNGMYLDLVGYDPVNNSVRRTDLSYDKFVRREVARMKQWAAEENDSTISSLASQASQSGIRPSGSSSKGLGKLKPGDISKMSAEDFAKNEAEIDRQILAQLS